MQKTTNKSDRCSAVALVCCLIFVFDIFCFLIAVLDFFLQQLKQSLYRFLGEILILVACKLFFQKLPGDGILR